MQIAVVLYPRFTALDAVGPFEVLAFLPGAQSYWLLAAALFLLGAGMGLAMTLLPPR